MSKLRHYSYCMTLRLDHHTESELETLAYDMGVSKAQAVRFCIRRAVAEARQRELAYERQREAL
jgi:hypothetical protein